jgi:hypothetical protein
MPVAQLTNIIGADGEGFSTGPQVQDVVNITTTAIAFGSLVALQTPVTGTTTTLFGVGTATSVATTAPLNIGIAIGGGPNTGTGSTIGAATTAGTAGQTGQVVIHGHTRALIDSTTSPTVVGHRLIIGGTTAGCLSDAGTTTAAAGVNYGVALEAVTISGTSSLVNIWFEKT